MQHVDEGHLHAYLDGELTAVERQRVDDHLAGCEACRVRLGEERELAQRASDLLGLLEPPLRAAPSFARIRERAGAARRRRPLTVPLAWAATVLLAIGIGWYARGSAFQRTPAEEEHVAAAPRAEAEMPDAARQAPRQAPPAVASRGRAAAPAADAVSGAAPIAPRDQAAGVARAQAHFPEAMIVTRADTAAAKPAAPAPSPAAGAGAPAARLADRPVVANAVRGDSMRQDTVARAADAVTLQPAVVVSGVPAWEAASFDEASEAVGARLVVIPDLPIDRIEVTVPIRGNDGFEGTPVRARVTQRLSTEWVIHLDQWRTSAAGARERDRRAAQAPRAEVARLLTPALSRRIGELEVDISSPAPVPADSLRRLLDRARPAPE